MFNPYKGLAFLHRGSGKLNIIRKMTRNKLKYKEFTKNATNDILLSTPGIAPS